MSEWIPPVGGGYQGKQRVLDIDGDGAVDFLTPSVFPFGAAAPPNAAFTCSLNDGSGRISARRYSVWPPTVPLPVIDSFGVGDLDHDGETDVLVTTYPFQSFAPLFVAFRGDGRGNFAASAAITFQPPLAYGTRGLALHDFTGDGADDVVVLLDTALPPALYVNDGVGHFQELPNALGNRANGIDLGFADFDRDGDLDYVSAEGRVFTNDGQGYFRESFVFPPVVGGQALDVADVDGDGYPDILFAPYPPSMYLWMNDGQGGFRDETSRFLVTWQNPLGSRAQVQFVDLDGDGDLDVFATVPARSYIEVYLNDGSTHFTDGRAALGLTGIVASHAVDMDRDGDIDLLFGVNYNIRGRWYPNLLTNVVTNDPVVGGSFNVELYAPAGHVVTYLLGFARQDTFLPGIGWSALDPALTIAWPQAALVPASRLVTTSLSVPNLASLRGLQLHTQGVDVDPATSTIHAMNVWPATIQ